MVHNIFHMRPYRRWNPIEYFIARVSDELQNNLVIQFFRIGVYDYKFPIIGRRIRSVVPEAPKTVDFFGILIVLFDQI